MIYYSLYGLLGAYALSAVPALPPAWMVISVVAAAAIAVLIWRNAAKSPVRGVAAFILGAAILWSAASSELADRLDAALQGKNLTITARVIDFPSRKNNSLRLLVRPLTPAGLPSRVRLSWYAPSRVPALGEVWRFRVRLKRPRGYFNPGGFDYEGWLHRQGIGATGYVTAQPGTQLLHQHGLQARPGFATILRRRYAARIDALFPAGESRAVLKAVTVGARGEISDAQWRLYARTGTSHLMAISGLHIGLAAGGAFVLAWALLGLIVRRRNIRDIASLVAIVVAFSYAELSGFAVPAQRAFLMALMAALAILLRRPVCMQRLLVMACLVVFCSNPLSIYAPGFILSFTAVALLLWAARSYEPVDSSGRWWQASHLLRAAAMLLRVQLMLLFGLMPLIVALFSRVQLLAPLANLVVVPVFNLVTVPASLLGLLFSGPAVVAGDGLLKLAFASINAALWVIGVIGRIGSQTLEPGVRPEWAWLLAAATVLWAVLPRGWPGRHIAVLALLATLLDKPLAPAGNCMELTVLDVGQGLAVVVRTRHHALVYDTGPSFRNGSSAAKLVVAPFLKSRGVRAIDVLLVSHSDLDHAGGVGWLGKVFDIRKMIVGEKLPEAGMRSRYCRAGQSWQWDAVRFRILYPHMGGYRQGNNASCVLLVAVGEYAILLTGDIEARAERSIIAERTRSSAGERELNVGGPGSLPRVDLVVVPHHGSRSSSSAEFVAAFKPAVAVVSAGYRNRWGFPKPDIVARWEAGGAKVVTTGQVGAVSRRYCAGQAPSSLRLEREFRRHYWLDRGYSRLIGIGTGTHLRRRSN